VSATATASTSGTATRSVRAQAGPSDHVVQRDPREVRDVEHDSDESGPGNVTPTRRPRLNHRRRAQPRSDRRQRGDDRPRRADRDEREHRRRRKRRREAGVHLKRRRDRVRSDEDQQEIARLLVLIGSIDGSMSAACTRLSYKVDG